MLKGKRKTLTQAEAAPEELGEEVKGRIALGLNRLSIRRRQRAPPPPRALIYHFFPIRRKTMMSTQITGKAAVAVGIRKAVLGAEAAAAPLTHLTLLKGRGLLQNRLVDPFRSIQELA